jgi:hypothetical protein
MTDGEQLEYAIAKLEELNNHHPSMVLFSEAKMLYKTVPVLIQLLTLAVANWDDKWPEDFAETYVEWIELAKIINEEKEV